MLCKALVTAVITSDSNLGVHIILFEALVTPVMQCSAQEKPLQSTLFTSLSRQALGKG